MKFTQIKNIRNANKKITYNYCTCLNKMIISCEKRKRIVFIYVFHEDYFDKNLDDSFTIYNMADDKFYNTFKYVISENDMSINEYSSDFETEQECSNWLKLNNYKTLQYE